MTGAEKAPTGLAAAGSTLWGSIIGDLGDGWELDARELHLLERACNCADEIAALQAAVERDGVTTTGSRGQTVVHPAVSEARQLRLAQLRLLGALEMTDPAAARRGRAANPAQLRAIRAADARWDRGANRG